MGVAGVEDMLDGWDRRHQMMLRVVAKAVWWIVGIHVGKEDKDRFQPVTVARSLPGFHYMEGEERATEDVEE